METLEFLEFKRDLLLKRKNAWNVFWERYAPQITMGIKCKCDADSEDYWDFLVYTLERIFKELEKEAKNIMSWAEMDNWMRRQTYSMTIRFRRRFWDWLAQKYPESVRAAIPYPFRDEWCDIFKTVYRCWVRGETLQRMALKADVTEDEADEILQEILIQLNEKGLRGKIDDAVGVEAFEKGWKRPSGYHDTDEQIHGSPSSPDAQMRLQTLHHAMRNAFLKLQTNDRRLLRLKFDKGWKLRMIADRSETLCLEDLTPNQVFSRIDDILNEMLPCVKAAWEGIDDVSGITVKVLKNYLNECGTPQAPKKNPNC